MINVIIVSGFLGSGKTTVIKKILNSQERLGKVMLLENEFGEIGIDGQLLKNNISVKEINNGCICCSLEGKLEEALDEIATYDIDTLIVEPSGVAKLSEIQEAFRTHHVFCIASSITMVDVTKANNYHKNFREFYDDQINHADCVVLSRSDVADNEVTKKAMYLCEDLNEQAVIVSTPIEQLENNFVYELLVAAFDKCSCQEEEGCCCCHHDHEHDECHHHDDEECQCHHHHDEHEHSECCHHEHHDHEHCCCHHHNADDTFVSLGFKTANIYDKDELKEMLEKLPETIIRAKGIVAGKDGWIHFEYTPGEIYINDGDVNYTGLISIIGTTLNKDELKGIFKLND